MKRLKHAPLILLLAAATTHAAVTLTSITVTPSPTLPNVNDITITMSNTVPGQQYLFEFSPDLKVGFFPYQFVTATGTTHTAKFNTTNTIRTRFYRTRVWP